MKKNILILSLYKPLEGLAEYSKIYINGYSSEAETDILCSKNYWFLISMCFGFTPNFIKKKISNYNKYSYIHIVDNPLWDLALINLLIKNTSCNIIYTMHDPIPHSENKTFKKILRLIIKWKNKKILKLASKRFKPHLHSQKLLPKKISPDENIIFAPHPRSIVNKSVEDYFDLNNINKDVIVFLGGTNHYKGLDLLMKELKKIDHVDYDKYYFLIAGRGIEKFLPPKFENLNVHFLKKKINTHEFDSIIKHSNAIILPYRDATASGVITRAISLESIVICTNVGIFNEYILHEKNGIMIYDYNIVEALNCYNNFKSKNYIVNLRSLKNKFEPKKICSHILSHYNDTD